jgi:DNA-binding transcriptional LysR family regulator
MRLLVSRHLENFLAVYAAGNMHLAAERKGISQPALTKSLRLLEADLNAELFRRTAKGLEPTEAGHVLHRYARAIERDARFAALDINSFYRDLNGGIRMGAGQSLSLSIFPEVIVEFHREFPGVEMMVETGITSRLMRSLAREDLDLLVAARPATALPDKLTSFPLFRCEMVAVCRQGHPLLDKPGVGLGDLAAHERIGLIEDHDFDRRIVRLPGAAGTLKPFLESTSMSLMFGVIAATDCYAIISSLILPRARREGLERIALDRPLWPLDIDLICRSTLAPSQPVTTIRRLIETKAAEQALSAP